LMFKKSVTLLY